MVGVKVGLPVFHFLPQNWVSLDWLGQFTASQPFQSLIISMMNSPARLRFEFIMYNHHHTPAFESWVATGFSPVPSFLHKDGVCLDWFKIITASQPFQHLIISMMNGWRRLRLVHMLYNGHHNVLFQSREGSKLACLHSTFHNKIEWVWTDLSDSQHLNPSILSP